MISRSKLDAEMRRLGLISLALAFCLASHGAQAGKRVALILGNSGYQNVTALANPANDAAAMAEMFRKASFDVVDSRRDLKYMEMRRALRDFTEQARGADIAVIYFAGHGLEVDGTNYAVPVDAVLERDSDADDEAVSLNRILLAVEPATKLRLVILDACRDNPFSKKMKRSIASRSLGRGLVGVEASKPNTFIAFAAKEGSTASDGDGRNSPFTTALLNHLTTPGLDIRKAFGFIRDDVLSATGGQQEPYTTNSLGGNDVALVAAPAVSSTNADIRTDYELAERVGTGPAWDSFIAAHPTGFYAELARAQRNKLEQGRPSPAVPNVAARPAAAPAQPEKPAEVVVATHAPDEVRPERSVPPDLPRLLQAELKRVGCKSGEVDGKWDAPAQRALAAFNVNAGTRFDVKLASLDALESVRGKTARVCPLECEHGFRVSGDACVKIVCEDGYVLGAKNSCEKRPEHKATASRRRGRPCFVYSGSSFCE
jgi:hypothetical protein